MILKSSELIRYRVEFVGILEVSVIDVVNYVYFDELICMIFGKYK